MPNATCKAVLHLKNGVSLITEVPGHYVMAYDVIIPERHVQLHGDHFELVRKLPRTRVLEYRQVVAKAKGGAA